MLRGCTCRGLGFDRVRKLIGRPGSLGARFSFSLRLPIYTVQL